MFNFNSKEIIRLIQIKVLSPPQNGTIMGGGGSDKIVLE